MAVIKILLPHSIGQPCAVALQPGQNVHERQEMGNPIEGELGDFKCLSIGLHASISDAVIEVTEDYINY